MAVKKKKRKSRVECRDAASLPLKDNSVDLVFTSPPYEDARKPAGSYTGQDWVDWCLPIFLECVRVSRGLVAFVIEGRTKNFCWSATPALLMADLKRSDEMERLGADIRKPPIYYRVGIPGGGGKDWWRNDYEFVVCASKGKLPWSDPVAIGHPPKYPRGGDPTHRAEDGERVRVSTAKGYKEGKVNTTKSSYRNPEKTNPGNVVFCHGGGGHMGSDLAHENEAPFPLQLAEAFVQCFCPPNGLVLDPMAGSGTTAHAAIRHGRRFICYDNRESQVELINRRVEQARKEER